MGKEQALTRTKILDVALSLINEEGILSLQIERIVHELAISKGNLNYYFPRKSDILVALFENYQTRIFEIYTRYNREALSISELFELSKEIYLLMYTYRGLVVSNAATVLLKHVPHDMINTFDDRLNQVKQVLERVEHSGNIRTFTDEKEKEDLALHLIAFSMGSQTMIENYYLKENSTLDEAVAALSKNHLKALTSYLTESGKTQWASL